MRVFYLLKMIISSEDASDFNHHWSVAYTHVSMHTHNVVFCFVLFFKERAQEGGGAEGERNRQTDRHNPKQAPCSSWSLTRGSIPRPWDHDLSRNQESDTQPILDFGSDHDLTVGRFEPHTGLCADSPDPVWDSFSVLC